jgi:hypothetical protein
LTASLVRQSPLVATIQPAVSFRKKSEGETKKVDWQPSHARKQVVE